MTTTAQLPLQRQPRSPPKQRPRAADQPPVGRPCGSVESANIKTKTFYERKTKTKPSQPEAEATSRWSALQRWHTNRGSQGNEMKLRTTEDLAADLRRSANFT